MKRYVRTEFVINTGTGEGATIKAGTPVEVISCALDDEYQSGIKATVIIDGIVEEMDAGLLENVKEN
jgi:hypothetical protein